MMLFVCVKQIKKNLSITLRLRLFWFDLICFITSCFCYLSFMLFNEHKIIQKKKN